MPLLQSAALKLIVLIDTRELTNFHRIWYQYHKLKIVKMILLHLVNLNDQTKRGTL